MTIFLLFSNMSLSVEYLTKLGRVKRVSCIMLKDRQYVIPEQENDFGLKNDLQIGAFYLKLAKRTKTTLGLAMSCTYTKQDSKEKIFVLFMDGNYDELKKKDKMISTEQAKSAIILWKKNFQECVRCILVSPGRLSPDAKKEASSFGTLSVLTHDFLLIPVGRHILVPKHECLTKDEEKIFQKSRKLDKCQLPQLKVSDPICLYYGFVSGNIIKVSRPGWTVFRIVE